MAVTAYNAKDCTISVDDVYITGVAEDMVTGEKDEELFTTSVGAQGDVLINETNNPLGTITLKIQGTSPQKDKMMNLATERKIFPIWITNTSIGERFGGSQARIKNLPSLEHSAELGDREFQIQVFDYVVESI